MKRKISKSAVFLLLLFVSPLLSSDEEGTRIWNNLASMENLKKIPPSIQAINGKTTRIPGFMVVLEMDGKAGEYTSEFLLVPAPGMCIHVPPPPPNLTVHVKMKPGKKARFSWEPVWVTGLFTVKQGKNKFNTSYYYMEGVKVEKYE